MMADPFDAAATTAEVAQHWYQGNLDAEAVLLERAGAGEIEAQRVMLEGMQAQRSSRKLAIDSYLAGAEIFARMVAARGLPSDRQRLAAVLSLQAARCRALHLPDAAASLEVECLLMLNRLADEGSEEAAQSLNTFAAKFSEEAVVAAAAEAKQAPKLLAPTPIASAPSVEVLDWEALLASLPPLTRWERLRLWLSDRYWDVRLRWWDLTDWMRARFGR